MNNSSVNYVDVITEFNTFYDNEILPILEGPVLTGIVGMGLATMLLGKDRMLSIIESTIEMRKL